MAEQLSAPEIVATIISGEATAVELIDGGIINSESNIDEIASGLADNTVTE